MASDDRGSLQFEVGTWAEMTFPDSTIGSIWNHLLEEVGELGLELTTAILDGDPVSMSVKARIIEESADCLLLLLHLAHRLGLDLMAFAADKHEKNLRRTWEIAPNDRGYQKHVEVTDGE